MPTVTLSSKNQINLSIELARNLGLKAGDKLVVTLIEDHLVPLPDAIIVATALQGSCDALVGNDARMLNNITGLPYLYMDHYIS